MRALAWARVRCWGDGSCASVTNAKRWSGDGLALNEDGHRIAWRRARASGSRDGASGTPRPSGSWPPPWAQPTPTCVASGSRIVRRWPSLGGFSAIMAAWPWSASSSAGSWKLAPRASSRRRSSPRPCRRSPPGPCAHTAGSRPAGSGRACPRATCSAAEGVGDARGGLVPGDGRQAVRRAVLVDLLEDALLDRVFGPGGRGIRLGQRDAPGRARG